MYRTIIVGRGLIGSAAARHLSAWQDGVVVIGPDEPADRATHAGVFASHYDEGRMTRITDPDPAWAETARRSIARYPEIEAASGVGFFTNAGFLGIGGPDTDYLARGAATARSLGAAVETLDAAGVRGRFGFLAVPDDADGLYEGVTAGHVSPRRMVRAQSAVAEAQGATLLPLAAVAVRRAGDGVEVETDDGAIHRAERALVAAGAFTEACGLSPSRLDLRVFGRTVVLAAIDDGLDAALRGMPTLIHAATGAYILPPIDYPDGRRYLKIGIGTPDDIRLRTRDDLTAWFKGPGSEANRREFQAFITALIPPLAACTSWHVDTCAVAQTGSGLPVIDYVDGDRIAVAAGGNGKGAKSADDWGWLAATLVAGRDWDHPVPRSALSLPAA